MNVSIDSPVMVLHALILTNVNKEVIAAQLTQPVSVLLVALNVNVIMASVVEPVVISTATIMTDHIHVDARITSRAMEFKNAIQLKNSILPSIRLATFTI